MGIATAPEVLEMMVDEVRLVSVSFDKVLDSGETITGTPTAAEETTSNLTISDVAANTAALTIHGETVTIGRALQFKVLGQVVSGSPYGVLMTVATDSTPAQTIKRRVIIKVVSE